MTLEEIHSRVKTLLVSVLKIPGTGDVIHRKSLPQWDSLKHLEVVFSLEDAFSVEFSEEEISRFSSSLAMAEAVFSRKESG